MGCGVNRGINIDTRLANIDVVEYYQVKKVTGPAAVIFNGPL